MAHPALLDASHRPWPLPRRPWVLTMDWRDLLFLHWPVAADQLQRHLPAGVEVETSAGSAWLGVVPFRMSRTRFRWLPPLPTAHTFPELNVRTYVRAGGRAGIWFFSLDAASHASVTGARLTFGLPYFDASMHCERLGDHVRFTSTRTDRRAPAAMFAANWHTTGPFTTPAPGTLEHFLVERYCLFAVRRGTLLCGEIAHAPWRLAPASVELQACEMTQLLGCKLAGPPVSALVAGPLRVAAFRPLAWPR